MVIGGAFPRDVSCAGHSVKRAGYGTAAPGQRNHAEAARDRQERLRA
ncbi:hypothetical protein HMPREF9946_01536 [Acetobacteraceae bacterium AT-5844]|nr:hypothetical protein HMPREF9946_01536 [Acetobacteraceae bacterium AT-5844]